MCTGPTADEIIAMRERIKSAPIRRKLKTAAARRKKDKEELSSSDEGETNPKGKTSTAAKKAIRQGKGKTGNDIITMVSLVSPAGSDTEDSVINLPLESLPVEEKMETTNTKPLTQESTKPASPAFVVPNFVALRKATKSGEKSRLESLRDGRYLLIKCISLIICFLLTCTNYPPEALLLYSIFFSFFQCPSSHRHSVGIIQPFFRRGECPQGRLSSFPRQLLQIRL